MQLYHLVFAVTARVRGTVTVTSGQLCAGNDKKYQPGYQHLWFCRLIHPWLQGPFRLSCDKMIPNFGRQVSIRLHGSGLMIWRFEDLVIWKWRRVLYAMINGARRTQRTMENTEIFFLNVLRGSLCPPCSTSLHSQISKSPNQFFCPDITCNCRNPPLPPAGAFIFLGFKN